MIHKEVSNLLAAICPRICTRNKDEDQTEQLESLAAALGDVLPTVDCRRLAKLLGDNCSGAIAGQ
jgi:hypothetical protein